MLDIGTILAPTDLSERSARALKHAAAMAVHFRARLIAVHVAAPAPHEYQLLGKGLAPEMAQANLDELQARLDAQLQAVAPIGQAEAVLTSGDPAHQIERLIGEHDVDLAVVATHGHGRFRRLLLGSVVAKVLHDADCPVLTGAHLTDEPAFRAAPYEAVACALALRDVAHSAKVLRWAADFARSWSASLHVVHVPPAIDWSAGEWMPDETQRLVREASHEKLEELLAEVGCEATVHAEGAETASYVAQVAAETGAGALVIGRSAERGLLGGGSDGYRLIRESPVPVVSV